MNKEFPGNGQLTPERWYGEKLGHLSRHGYLDLLHSEAGALGRKITEPLNVFAIKESFLNAGGKEEHWREISGRLSVLHPIASPTSTEHGRPVLRLLRTPEGKDRTGAKPSHSAPQGRARAPAQRTAARRPLEDWSKQLGQILLERGAITEGQLERALQQQLRTGHRLGSILVATGTVDPHKLAQAVAAQTGLLAVDLERYPVDPAAAALLPTELCEKHCILPIKASGDVVLVAMGNPGDVDAYTASREALEGRQVRRVVAAEIQIEKRLEQRRHSFGAGR